MVLRSTISNYAECIDHLDGSPLDHAQIIVMTASLKRSWSWDELLVLNINITHIVYMRTFTDMTQGQKQKYGNERKAKLRD